MVLTLQKKHNGKWEDYGKYNLLEKSLKTGELIRMINGANYLGTLGMECRIKELSEPETTEDEIEFLKEEMKMVKQAIAKFEDEIYALRYTPGDVYEKY